MLQTATNPSTGEVVVLVGDEWKPAQSTATNERGEKAYLVDGAWHTATAVAAPEKRKEPATGAEYQLNKAKSGAAAFLGFPGDVVDATRKMRPERFNPLTALPALAADFIKEKTGYGDWERSLPTERAIATSDTYREAFGHDKDMKAPSEAHRLLGGVTEFAAAGGPLAVRSAIVAPQRARAAASEIGSIVSGGAGSVVGGDVGEALGGETGRRVGEFAGGFGGGAAGLATPTIAGKISDVARPYLASFAPAKVAQWLAPTGKDIRSHRIASKELGGALDANPQTADNLAHAESTRANLRDIPAIDPNTGRPIRGDAGDFQPTIGQASGAEGVIAREVQLASQSPEELGKYAARARENLGVIDKAKDIAFPPGGYPLRGAKNILSASARALDAQLEQVTQRRDALARSLDTEPQQQIGEKLDNLRGMAQGIARNAKNARVQEIYATANRLGVKEDMTDVLDFVKRTGGDDASTFQTLPPVYAQVLREYGKRAQPGKIVIPDDVAAKSGITGAPTKTEASFEELHSLWRETNSQWAAASRAGNTTAAYHLDQMKRLLRGKLAKYESQGYGELSAKFSEFNQWFASKYAPAFYEGVGGRMNARGRFGDVLKPEDVVNKFFTPSGLDDFNLVTAHLDDAGRAAANDVLKDGIVGLFREHAMKDGVIQPARAQAFIHKHRETLAKVPDIQDALLVPAEVSATLAGRADRLTRAQRELDSSIIAKLAKTEDPQHVIRRALEHPKEMRALLASASDDSTRKAVLRGIADAIPDAAARAGMDPIGFVVANEQTLKGALNRLGPAHFDNLKTIAGAQSIIGRTVPPSHSQTGKPMGAVEEITGSSPRTIWAQVANTSAGRQSGTSAVLHLLSRFGIKTGEEKVNDVLRAVIYHPELAADLAKAAKMPYHKPVTNGILEHLQNAGIRATLVADEEKR